MNLAYKWIYSEVKQVPQDLLEIAGSEIIAELLLNRGIDTLQKAKSFLNAESLPLTPNNIINDMEKAVERINAAIETQEHIVIYGDFDADGVTSTSLLYKCLRHIGANASFYIPDRADEGHGLNSASVCKLISSKQARLIITVDCGISNVAEVKLAKGFGTDVIITDHHEPHDIVPDAYAIVNPKVAEEENEVKYLAGVGVAYKLACCLLDHHNKTEYSNELSHLVTIGTIADLVPLIDENRILVAKGLKLIQEKKPPAIAKLFELAGYKDDKIVSGEMIAFGIAPRINAIGRLESAELAVSLLVSEDKEEIDNISKTLNHNNRLRQQMCHDTFLEADQKLLSENLLEKDKAIILSDSSWHPGIIGIVASKLVEKYYRPTFLICIDNDTKEGRCSARSIEGLNLHDTLTIHSDYFTRFGGHALAAGFSFDLNKVSFKKLKENLNNTINQNLKPESLKRTIKIEKNIELSDLTVEFIESLRRLAPFGEGNPQPIFSITGLILKQYKTIGAANNHLRIFLESDNNIIEAVWWQRGAIDIKPSEKVDVAFIPELNTFGGKIRVQLVIKDIKKSDNQSDSGVDTTSKIQWIDYRNGITDKQKLVDCIKSNNDVAMYVEDSNSIKELKTKDYLKQRLISRTTCKKINQLVIYDLPPDKAVFDNILAAVEPKVIHFVGKKSQEQEPSLIIKLLSGMLKYAYTHKAGEVGLNILAEKLFISEKSVLIAIKLLEKAGIVNLIENKSAKIKFEFKGSSNLGEIVSMEEYQEYLASLKESTDFRNKLMLKDIEEIKKLFYTEEKNLVEV